MTGHSGRDFDGATGFVWREGCGSGASLALPSWRGLWTGDCQGFWGFIGRGPAPTRPLRAVRGHRLQTSGPDACVCLEPEIEDGIEAAGFDRRHPRRARKRDEGGLVFRTAATPCKGQAGDPECHGLIPCSRAKAAAPAASSLGHCSWIRFKVRARFPSAGRVSAHWAAVCGS